MTGTHFTGKAFGFSLLLAGTLAFLPFMDTACGFEFKGGGGNRSGFSPSRSFGAKGASGGGFKTFQSGSGSQSKIYDQSNSARQNKIYNQSNSVNQSKFYNQSTTTKQNKSYNSISTTKPNKTLDRSGSGYQGKVSGGDKSTGKTSSWGQKTGTSGQTGKKGSFTSTSTQGKTPGASSGSRETNIKKDFGSAPSTSKGSAAKDTSPGMKSGSTTPAKTVTGGTKDQGGISTTLKNSNKGEIISKQGKATGNTSGSSLGKTSPTDKTKLSSVNKNSGKTEIISKQGKATGKSKDPYGKTAGSTDATKKDLVGKSDKTGAMSLTNQSNKPAVRHMSRAPEKFDTEGTRPPYTDPTTGKTTEKTVSAKTTSPDGTVSQTTTFKVTNPDGTSHTYTKTQTLNPVNGEFGKQITKDGQLSKSEQGKINFSDGTYTSTTLTAKGVTTNETGKWSPVKEWFQPTSVEKSGGNANTGTISGLTGSGTNTGPVAGFTEGASSYGSTGSGATGVLGAISGMIQSLQSGSSASEGGVTGGTCGGQQAADESSPAASAYSEYYDEDDDSGYSASYGSRPSSSPRVVSQRTEPTEPEEAAQRMASVQSSGRVEQSRPAAEEPPTTPTAAGSLSAESSEKILDSMLPDVINHAIQRYGLKKVVDGADIERTKAELVGLLKWRFGDLAETCEMLKELSPDEIRSALSDDAAAILLDLVSIQADGEPQMFVPLLILDNARSHTQDPSALVSKIGLPKDATEPVAGYMSQAVEDPEGKCLQLCYPKDFKVDGRLVTAAAKVALGD